MKRQSLPRQPPPPVAPADQCQAAVAQMADHPTAGRPSGRGKPGKHDAIVQAATRIFLRDGFTDTSVDAIASEAGVAKQTIYNHFRDKEHLFLSVMRAAQRKLGSELELSSLVEWLGASDDLGRDLRAFGREWIHRRSRRDIVALRNLIMAERDRHPQLLREWARPQMALDGALAQAIGIRARHGQLEVPDPHLAARQLTMVLFNEATVRSLYGDRRLTAPEIEDIVDTGVGMWLRCYQRRPATSPPPEPLPQDPDRRDRRPPCPAGNPGMTRLAVEVPDEVARRLMELARDRGQRVDDVAGELLRVGATARGRGARRS